MGKLGHGPLSERSRSFDDVKSGVYFGKFLKRVQKVIGRCEGELGGVPVLESVDGNKVLN